MVIHFGARHPPPVDVAQRFVELCPVVEGSPKRHEPAAQDQDVYRLREDQDRRDRSDDVRQDALAGYLGKSGILQSAQPGPIAVVWVGQAQHCPQRKVIGQ